MTQGWTGLVSGLWYMDWTRVLGGLVCLVLVLISKGSVWFLVIKSQGPKMEFKQSLGASMALFQICSKDHNCQYMNSTRVFLIFLIF